MNGLAAVLREVSWEAASHGRRFLALLLISFLACPAAYAQQKKEDAPKDSLALALQYYARCEKTMFSDLPENQNRDFCACTSDMARKRLTYHELETMATGKGAQPVDDVKLSVQVYAPCMHFLLAYTEFDDCMYNPKNQRFFKTEDALGKMCQCLTDRVTAFAATYGEQMMGAILTRRGPVEDPFETFTGWYDYANEKQIARRTCLKAYAYK